MNEISCDICMDLMPLVQDGVASDDSIKAVKKHLESCKDCRDFFEGFVELPSDTEKLFKKLRSKIRVFVGMLLIFGVFVGISLTGSSALFMNILIMPILGVIGYYLFRWKALYITPCMLLVLHMISNLFRYILGYEYEAFLSVLSWTMIYSFFTVIGCLIAGLLYFGFGRER